MLVTDSKYGFRGIDDALSITLLRSSFDPDPYPELGVHTFRFAVCAVKGSSNSALIKHAHRFNHPFTPLSGTVHGGSRSTVGSLMSLEGEGVVLSAVKQPEGGGERLIVRVYGIEGERAKAVLHFSKEVRSAFYVDLNERPIPMEGEAEVAGERVQFEVPPFGVVSLYLEFA